MNTTTGKLTSIPAILILFVLSVFNMSACTRHFDGITPAKPITVSGFKLNTYVSVTAYGGNATDDILNQAIQLCDYYEKIFSRTIEDSELSHLNSHQTNIVSSELGELIQYGITYSSYSNGSFDLSIGAVSSLWDFTTDTPVVPDEQLLADSVKNIDYSKIVIMQNADGSYTVNIPDGMIIDLGAIAKGYIADRIRDFLLQNDINSAIINLGGNVLCVGSKPTTATSTDNFNVSVRKPFAKEQESLLILSVQDKSVVSSGTYERCFSQNGIFYHHILNPHTGYPYDNGLTQVTIISDKSITGDCLSTACFTLGADNGMALIERTDGVEAIMVTADGDILYSSGAGSYIKK